VEYDYLDPDSAVPLARDQADPRASTWRGRQRDLGYEEAACQGLIAGINAALSLRGAEPSS
jgi:tRNA uridine 5-carboxymethylaminomethyl modification enzyme